jgi:putative transposase
MLGKLMNSINGSSSYYINKLDNQRGRKIWYSYWDTCIRNKNDFFIRFNYIHNNPIKHGLINTFDNLRFYDFSSYIYYLKTKGQEWLTDTFMSYPIADYIDEYDDYDEPKGSTPEIGF